MKRIRLSESQLRRVVKKLIKEASSPQYYIEVTSQDMTGSQMLDIFLNAGFEQGEWEPGAPVKPTDDSVEVVGDKEAFFDMLSGGTLGRVTKATVGHAPIDVKKYQQPSEQNLGGTLRSMTGMRGYEKFFSDPKTAKNQFKVSSFNDAEDDPEGAKRQMKASIEKCGFKVLFYDGPEYSYGEYVTFIVQGDPQAFIRAVESGKCPDYVAGIQLQVVDYIDKRNMVTQHHFEGNDMNPLFAQSECIGIPPEMQQSVAKELTKIRAQMD